MIRNGLRDLAPINLRNDSHLDLRRTIYTTALQCFSRDSEKIRCSG